MTGRKVTAATDKAKDIIINLRKKYYSVPEIKAILDGLGHTLSEKNIYNVVSKEGFSRLPWRSKLVKYQLEGLQERAEKSAPLGFSPEEFKSLSGGILMFAPIIKRYKIDAAIGLKSIALFRAHECCSKTIIRVNPYNPRNQWKN